MEKYSEFNDPYTGINPFLRPRCVRIGMGVLIRALVVLPVYILYRLGLVSVRRIITVEEKRRIPLYKKIYANSVGEFDEEIIRSSCDVRGTLLFPEGATTNNRCILSYGDEKCDYVVGLRYSPECIYSGGSRLTWLIRFLGSRRRVVVDCERGSNLERVTGLKQVKLTQKDKEKFIKKTLRE
ncbi:hypothetical protein ECANGB1_2788 [Enterospora canceri]|uniref:Uncharacterized protein n=1 Tax=Enterospora canceri TaxID=1081671 RepID=A0A1Y1S8D0_9MICR|nr:hypothetical protein ECANGB1_2788 [Enterospora canceri]